jgi:ATP-binding protein involved in chromosome partitioning
MDDLTLKGNVIEAIAKVIDPQTDKSILDAHLLEEVNVEDGQVDIRLNFPEAYPREARWDLEDKIVDKTEGIEGVEAANVHSQIQSGEDPYEGSEVHDDADADAGPGGQAGAGGGGGPTPVGDGPETAAERLEGVGRVIAVASGKGGVGKSTVAVNLALALQKQGFRVGLLDVDIYGPSLPTLLGVNERPTVKEKRIVPLEAHNLRLMSLGFLMDEDSPVIWRGPIVTGIIRQFLQDVDWSGIDYLIVDLPPGTGDAQLSLAQTVPVDGAIVVTTPSDLALVDAARGLRMFHTLNVDVLGIVENMSHYVWPGASELKEIAADLDDEDAQQKIEALLDEHEKAYIFGQGGGQREAKRLEIPFLGEIPLDPSVRKGGDEGKPVVIGDPDGPVTESFMALAQRVTELKSLDADDDDRKGLFSFVKS